MPSFLPLTIALVEPDPQGLLASSVEQKAARQAAVVDAALLSGWAVGRHGPVARVELVQHGTVLHTAPVEANRPQVAAQFPEIAWAAASGFQMVIDFRVFEAAPSCELRAVLDDQTMVPLAVLRRQSQPLPRADAQNLQPLLVTSLARSGSTWLMHLLAGHPEIVVLQRYPYEMRPALYWTHMLQVLTARPDPSQPIARPKTFRRDKFAVGANPFRTGALEQYPEVQTWATLTYRDQLARFCQDAIEGWYRSVAGSQAQPSAAYFAEKRHPVEHAASLWEMYPGMRELLLVRDFRDIASSIFAFNAQRGSDGFGRDRVDSDEALLESLRRPGTQLLEHWGRRAARLHLVRYEDLVATPADTLRSVLTYLGVDASAETVAGMLDRAKETEELQAHQTSASPEASIGRWRHDLEPALQAAANEIFRDILTGFGYSQDEVAPAPHDLGEARQPPEDG